jgi:hypothetical protein
MEKLITLFLTLLVIPLSVSANQEVDLTLPETPFDFEQMERDSKLIKELEERDYYRIFNNPDPLPTQEQIRYSWIIHTLDMATTIYALKTHDNIKERNPILGENPNNVEIIGLKLLILPIVHQNSSEHAMIYFNAITTATVINNLYVISRYD